MNANLYSKPEVLLGDLRGGLCSSGLCKQLRSVAAGKLLYAGLSTVQAWEGGTRRMPALAWEFLCMLQAFPEVGAARKRWLNGGPPWPESPK